LFYYLVLSLQYKLAFSYGMMHAKTFCRATWWRQQVTFIIVNRNKTKTMRWQIVAVFCKLLAITTRQNMWNNVRRGCFLSNLKQQSDLKMQTYICHSYQLYNNNFSNLAQKIEYHVSDLSIQETRAFNF